MDYGFLPLLTLRLLVATGCCCFDFSESNMALTFSLFMTEDSEYKDILLSCD